jgi:hypothetical protein
MKSLFTPRWRPALVGLGLLLAGATACSRFLEVSPQGQPTTGQFFQNATDAGAAVASCYAKLREYNLVAFNWFSVAVFPSDDVDKGSVPGDGDYLNDYVNFRSTATAGGPEGHWLGQYQQVNLCNQVIANVPGINMDASLRTRYVAEARFLRALAYFNLVRAFGGVPLYTKPAVTPEELNIPRASRDEVYTLIISDLTAAATLPTSYGAADLGRVTKGAALTLLAKAQLYQKNYAAALAASEQVQSLGYSLVSDYYQMFRIGGENGPESIFEVQCTTLPGNCDASNSYWALSQSPRPQFGWGFCTPTADLEAAFEPGDKRLAGTILYRGTITPDGDSISTQNSNPRYNMKAYVPNSVTKVCLYGADQNIRILRYAEALLLHAEAANELGQTSKALADLNQVRQRAGLAARTGLGQDALRQAIWQERRVELALEYGDRFFDLVRQGRAATVLKSKGFVAGKNEVFPIPLSQIQLSGGVLVQNPGY